MVTKIVLSLVLLTVVFIGVSFAFDCYECDSSCETSSGDFLKAKANIIKGCPGSCRKITTIDDVTTRDCYPYIDTDGCKKVKVTGTTTCTCNTNLCNLATRTTISVSMTVIVIATVMFNIFL